MRDWVRRRSLTCVSVLVVILLSGSPGFPAEFAGGSGDPNDPYRIATVEQLLSIGADPNLLDKHYVLAADLDLDPNLPGRRIFDRAAIAPNLEDGDDEAQIEFTGSFNGDNHTINNLTIRTDDGACLGLFGRIGHEGEVRDLGVENVSVTGQERIGALAGWSTGEIVHCHATGRVSGHMMVGGLVGQIMGDIHGCHSRVDVTGAEECFDLGGLVGAFMMEGIMSDCYATGHVSAGSKSRSLGGLIGDFDTLDGAVSKCYAKGDVSSGAESNCLGGLIGQG